MTNVERAMLDTIIAFTAQASDEFKEELVLKLDKQKVIEEFLDIDVIIDEKMEELTEKIKVEYEDGTVIRPIN